MHTTVRQEDIIDVTRNQRFLTCETWDHNHSYIFYLFLFFCGWKQCGNDDLIIFALDLTTLPSYKWTQACKQKHAFGCCFDILSSCQGEIDLLPPRCQKIWFLQLKLSMMDLPLCLNWFLIHTSEELNIYTNICVFILFKPLCGFQGRISSLVEIMFSLLINSITFCLAALWGPH